MGPVEGPTGETFEPSALASHLSGGHVHPPLGYPPGVVCRLLFVVRAGHFVVACCGYAQCSRILLLLVWPALRLQCACSGPVHAVRLSLCPRSHAWFGLIGLPQRGQIGVRPCRIRWAHAARMAWWRGPGSSAGLVLSVVGSCAMRNVSLFQPFWRVAIALI